MDPQLLYKALDERLTTFYSRLDDRLKPLERKVDQVYNAVHVSNGGPSLIDRVRAAEDRIATVEIPPVKAEREDAVWAGFRISRKHAWALVTVGVFILLNFLGIDAVTVLRALGVLGGVGG